MDRTSLIRATALAGCAVVLYGATTEDPWGFEQRRIEDAVAAHLIDPSSAQFREWTKGTNATCGEVNGKNRMGAYAGFSAFVYSAEQVHFRPGGGQIANVGFGDLPLDIADATDQLNELATWARLAQDCYQ